MIKTRTDVHIKKLDYTTEYEDGDPVGMDLHIIGRDEHGERVHIINNEIPSYFCVPEDEVDQELSGNQRVTGIDWGYESIFGDELAKIETRIPGDVPALRNDKTHFEADILYPNRFLIDSQIGKSISIPTEYANEEPEEVALDEIESTDFYTDTRIVYCDIEVMDDNGFPEADDAEEEVVTISFYDNFTDEYYCYVYHPDVDELSHEYAEVRIFDTEQEMLNTFAEYLTDVEPDVITGWNFDEFDARYLINRMDNLNSCARNDLSPLGSAFDDKGWKGKIKGIAVFDLLRGYKNLQFEELDSFGLEDVAQEELGTGKIKDTRKIHEQWEEVPEKLVEYNVKDVKLTVDLDEKLDIIRFYETVADIVDGRLSEVVDFSKAADKKILQEVGDRFVLPSKATVEGNEEFEGGAVFDPISGVRPNIGVLDLKSLYPMSMKTINAGPRTKDPDGDITAPNGVSFTTEKKSIVVDIIDELLEEREEYKRLRDEHPPGSDEYDKYDMMQNAVKIIMNTLYGLMGWDRFRMYDDEVAASVTAVGRDCIRYTEEVVNQLGYEVVYGDTDSVMLEFGQDVHLPGLIERGLQLEQRINGAYDEFALEELGVEEHFFQIEFEKLYRRYFQAGKKKRYAGDIIYKDGKQVSDIDIVGFEYKRSDYSKKARQLQLEVLTMLVKGVGLNGVSSYVRDEIAKIKKGEYEMDTVGMPSSVGKAFDEYESKTMSVKGSEYANEHLGAQIRPGDKPKGMYLKKIVNDIGDGDHYPMPDHTTPYICWKNPNILPDSFVWDWGEFIRVQVKKPLGRIFKGTDWSLGEVISGQEQTGLSTYAKESVGGDDGAFSGAEELTSSYEEDQFEANPEPVKEDIGEDKEYTKQEVEDDEPEVMELGEGSGDMFGGGEELLQQKDDEEEANEELEYNSSTTDLKEDEETGQASLGDW